MGLVEILWTVAGVLVPLLLGTAWAMIGLTPPEFLIARACVAMAAAVFIGVAFVWIVVLQWPNGARILVAATLGAISLIFFSEAFRLINAREVALAEAAAKVADIRKATREKLQSFYVSAGPILIRAIPKDVSDDDFKKYVDEANAWIVETDTWIRNNLGEAAAARFGDIGGILPINWDRAANPAHNNIINLLTKFRENLGKLIETAVWDKQSN